MRTALVLLLLLALAADPGLGDPAGEGRRAQDVAVAARRTPTLTPVYERLGLFDVYGTPWFAAIYLLLMVSLVGCFVPADRRLREGAPRPAARDAAPARPAARPRDVPHRRGARRRARPRPDPPAEPAAARGRARRGLGGRRARLPPRGGQPALPRLGARRDGRLRRRQPVRLPGRRDRRRRQRDVQQPHAVRRLQPGQPLRRGGPRRLLPRHRGLRRRVDDVRPGAGAGPQVRLARELRRG